MSSQNDNAFVNLIDNYNQVHNVLIPQLADHPSKDELRADRTADVVSRLDTYLQRFQRYYGNDERDIESRASAFATLFRELVIHFVNYSGSQDPGPLLEAAIDVENKMAIDLWRRIGLQLKDEQHERQVKELETKLQDCETEKSALEPVAV